MSLEIDWGKIVNDSNLTSQLTSFLNTHIQSFELPSYLSHLSVSKFSLGNTAPAITIRHIGNPFDEFYAIEDEHNVPDETDIQFIVELNFPSDLYLEMETNLLLNYPSTNFISLPIKLKFTELFIHSLASITVLNKKSYISFLCDIDEQEVSTDEQLQVQQQQQQPQAVQSADILTSRSNSYMGSVPLNYNSSAANFTTTSTSTNFLNTLNTSSLNNQNSNRIDIIKRLKIESELGQTKDIDGSILRNVGKIEKFLTEMLKDLIITELAWPSWLELDFNEDDEDEDGNSSDSAQ